MLGSSAGGKSGSLVLSSLRVAKSLGSGWNSMSEVRCKLFDFPSSTCSSCPSEFCGSPRTKKKEIQLGRRDPLLTIPLLALEAVLRGRNGGKGVSLGAVEMVDSLSRPLLLLGFFVCPLEDLGSFES